MPRRRGRGAVAWLLGPLLVTGLLTGAVTVASPASATVWQDLTGDLPYPTAPLGGQTANRTSVQGAGGVFEWTPYDGQTATVECPRPPSSCTFTALTDTDHMDIWFWEPPVPPVKRFDADERDSGAPVSFAGLASSFCTAPPMPAGGMPAWGSTSTIGISGRSERIVQGTTDYSWTNVSLPPAAPHLQRVATTTYQQRSFWGYDCRSYTAPVVQTRLCLQAAASDLFGPYDQRGVLMKPKADGGTITTAYTDGVWPRVSNVSTLGATVTDAWAQAASRSSVERLCLSGSPLKVVFPEKPSPKDYGRYINRVYVAHAQVNVYEFSSWGDSASVLSRVWPGIYGSGSWFQSAGANAHYIPDAPSLASTSMKRWWSVSCRRADAAGTAVMTRVPPGVGWDRAAWSTVESRPTDYYSWQCEGDPEATNDWLECDDYGIVTSSAYRQVPVQVWQQTGTRSYRVNQGYNQTYQSGTRTVWHPVSGGATYYCDRYNSFGGVRYCVSGSWRCPAGWSLSGSTCHSGYNTYEPVYSTRWVDTSYTATEPTYGWVWAMQADTVNPPAAGCTNTGTGWSCRSTPNLMVAGKRAAPIDVYGEDRLMPGGLYDAPATAKPYQITWRKPRINVRSTGASVNTVTAADPRWNVRFDLDPDASPVLVWDPVKNRAVNNVNDYRQPYHLFIDPTNGSKPPAPKQKWLVGGWNGTPLSASLNEDSPQYPPGSEDRLRTTWTRFFTAGTRDNVWRGTPWWTVTATVPVQARFPKLSEVDANGTWTGEMGPVETYSKRETYQCPGQPVTYSVGMTGTVPWGVGAR